MSLRYLKIQKNLWFGTINNGAAKFDGKALTYLTTENGLIGNTVTSFAEDKQGISGLAHTTGFQNLTGKHLSILLIKTGSLTTRFPSC